MSVRRASMGPMAQEFEGDLAGAVFWGCDLSGARFRDINFTGTRMTSVWLHDVDIDGMIERLVVNGVDVTDHVNAHDPWQPMRGMLRPDDVDGMRAAWEQMQRDWASTLDQANGLTDAERHASVNGEWSFVQTLRHLLMAMDKWFTVPLNGGTFHPFGLPNTGSATFPFPGLDPSADPTYEEVLAARAERSRVLAEYLAALSDGELDRDVEILENGTVALRECFYTVFEEEFEHRRYALRDLTALGTP
jgi:DinB superfamily/Pentapeptide repeats (8 copies)